MTGRPRPTTILYMCGLLTFLAACGSPDSQQRSASDWYEALRHSVGQRSKAGTEPRREKNCRKAAMSAGYVTLRRHAGTFGTTLIIAS